MIFRSVFAGLLTAAFAMCSAQAFAAPGWMGGSSVKGSGSIKTQSRDLGRFGGIALSLPAQVELRIGNSESVSIETDDNLMALVETAIENGTLQIRAQKNTSLDTRTLKIVVQARQIDHITVSGSGSVDAAALRAPKLQFEIGGAGSINVKNAECESASASIGGSGNLKMLGGAARNLSVSIGGSGDVAAGQLKADKVSVNIGGSGQATVWAREALSASIAGSGDVNYYGDPKLSSRVVGSGSTNRLGAAPR